LWTVDDAQFLTFGIDGRAHQLLAALGSGWVPGRFPRPRAVPMLSAERPAAALSASRAAASAT